MTDEMNPSPIPTSWFSKRPGLDHEQQAPSGNNPGVGSIHYFLMSGIVATTGLHGGRRIRMEATKDTNVANPSGRQEQGRPQADSGDSADGVRTLREETETEFLRGRP